MITDKSEHTLKKSESREIFSYLKWKNWQENKGKVTCEILKWSSEYKRELKNGLEGVENILSLHYPTPALDFWATRRRTSIEDVQCSCFAGGGR